MEFESAGKTAERLGVTVRAVQKWAKEGKISGAKKTGRDWMIPVDACRPGNEITKEIMGSDKYLILHLTGAFFQKGKCLDYMNEFQDGDEKNIALGEYYYYSGELEKASEILEPYLNSDDPGFLCTSAVIGAFANLSHGHINMTEYCVKMLVNKLREGYRIETEEDVIALVVLVHSIIAIQFHYDYDKIPPLEDYVRFLPEGLKLYGCYLLAYKAYFEKDYSRSLGIVNTAIACCRDVYPIPMAYLHIMSAVDLINLSKPEEANERMEKAWELVGEDKLVMLFVEHYGLLQGMIEVFFRKKYPEAFNKIISITKNFNVGWYQYHNKKTGNTVAGNLTTTEFTIAMLFNRGWRVKEIANHIELSERTVKNYLQIIYEKLGINSKKELERFMLK